MSVMRSTLFSVAVVGLSIPLALAGCESGSGDNSFLDEGTDDNGDTTGDGDTDGDGTDTDTDTEGEELGCNVESPYMGGWDIGCCQDEIVPNGWSPGAVQAGTIMPDWTFNDQFGEAVRLYDFCHEAIYFEYVALW